MHMTLRKLLNATVLACCGVAVFGVLLDSFELLVLGTVLAGIAALIDYVTFP